MPGNNELVPTRDIESKILLIREYKVMLDKDLAKLYDIPTKALNQAVKRNIKRFPDDFMFQLNDKEVKELVTNCDHLKNLKYSSVNPYVFTEHGILMLSSVLNSERAIQVNIQIMRTFSYLRKMLLSHKDLQDRLDALERNYDIKFKTVFDAIKLLLRNDLEINKKLTYEKEKQSNKKWGFQPPGK